MTNELYEYPPDDDSLPVDDLFCHTHQVPLVLFETEEYSRYICPVCQREDGGKAGTAMKVSDIVIIAWTKGQISEGRAAVLIGVDRLTLRAMRDELLGGNITGHEILELPAGTKMNQLIWWKVFDMEPTPPGNDMLKLPPFSTDMGAAWTITEKVQIGMLNNVHGRWEAYVVDGPYADAETAPLAICRAALLSLK